MNTVFAYAIVIAISQFCLTAGALAGPFSSILLFWLPDKVRAPLCAFFGGIAGSVLAVGLAFLIFRWLVGHDSFGIVPFLAATIPLSIPMYNDYKKARSLNDKQKELPERVAAFASSYTSTMNAAFAGELYGILVAGFIFL